MEEKKRTGYPSVDKPWLQYYSEEAINAKLPECTVYEWMYQNNAALPDDIALIYDNRRITYGELFKNIDQCASAFRELGVCEKEIVSVALPNIPEMVYVVYALNKIGAVANMIHPLAGKNELVAYLKETNSRVAVLLDKTYELLKDALDSACSIEHVVIASPAQSLVHIKRWIYNACSPVFPLPADRRLISWPDFIRAQLPIPPTCTADSSATALMVHTGGTTGEPKGVMLTNGGINSIIWQMNVTFAPKRQERVLTVLPPFIGYGIINSLLEPLTLGVTVVLIPMYDAKKQGRYFINYRPQHVLSIPAYGEELVRYRFLKGKDLSFLNLAFTGGDGMNEKEEQEINDFLRSHKVRNCLGKGLGCTEMGSCTTVAFGDCNRIGNVGIPLVKNHCKIVDPETGAEQPYNTDGEICFAGPSLMLGYYNNRIATDQMIHIHPDGVRWIHTGDTGCITEDGILYVRGRMKRIMITKGADGIPTKLFPDRIEKVILQHTAVDSCCVVALPDTARINMPMAAIVLKQTDESADEIIRQIRQACQSNLPAYMVPETIRCLPALPRTTIGKIDYRALERMAN